MIFPRSLGLLEGREQGVVFIAYRISANNVRGIYYLSKLSKKTIFYFINWIILWKRFKGGTCSRAKNIHVRKYSTYTFQKFSPPSFLNLELRWGIWVNLIFKYPYMESNVKLGCCSIISWCSMIFYDLFLSRFSL